MANTFLLTDYTSKVIGTFLKQKCPILQMAYRKVNEFNDHKAYGVGDSINIKIPGYPPVQLGIQTTTTDIVDRPETYTISDLDIYNIERTVNLRNMKMKVVDGRAAFLKNPVANAASKMEANPQAANYVDDYAYPAFTSIKAAIEKTLSDKANVSAFMTPVDVPSKLTAVNSYPSISQVKTLMDNLGWIDRRYAIMNNYDSTKVGDNLQNMFNQAINTRITKEGLIGNGTLAGFEMVASNAIDHHIAGEQFAVSPTFTVSSVSADGTTITFTGVDGVTSRLFKAGDKISIPSVQLLKKALKSSSDYRLVVSVAEDADGDGAGNVTVTITSPIIATGEQANVDSLPVATAPAELYPSHKNNWFFVPMGFLATPVELDSIVGADNSVYKNATANVIFQTMIQGIVSDGANSIRYSSLVATKAIPDYLVWLPSPLI